MGRDGTVSVDPAHALAGMGIGMIDHDLVVGELPWAPPAAGPVRLAERSRAAFERATGAAVTDDGQFFVARRDRLGRRRRFPRVIKYVDTNHGRWLLPGPTSAVPGTAELDEAARQVVATAPARSRTSR